MIDMKSIRLLLIALLLAVTGGDAIAQKIEQVTGIPKNETKAEKKAREKKLKVLADSMAFRAPISYSFRAKRAQCK